MTTQQQGILKPDVGDGDHALGAADAAVTLVEYGDYQCSHCAHAHAILARVRKTLGPRLRFVFRNFPLNEIHPEAAHAAEAAESVFAHAGEEAFWRMHDAIYEHQRDSDDALDDAHLLQYAEEAGADPADVEQDLADDTFESKVRDDFMSGVRSGVNGTPTFFINGHRFEGNWTDPIAFADALESAAR